LSLKHYLIADRTTDTSNHDILVFNGIISDAPTPNINRQLDSKSEIEIFSRFDPGIVDVIPIFL
jgi:hypothetical protein